MVRSVLTVAGLALFAAGAVISAPALPARDDDPYVHCATCSGADPCNACKSCNTCKYCKKKGRSCGVCKQK